MDPPQGVLARPGVVVLDEVRVDAERAPRVVAPALEQKAALVAVGLDLDQGKAVDAGVQAPGYAGQYRDAPPYAVISRIRPLQAKSVAPRPSPVPGS